MSGFRLPSYVTELPPGTLLIRRSDGLTLIKCKPSRNQIIGEQNFFEPATGHISHISEYADFAWRLGEFQQEFREYAPGDFTVEVAGSEQ